MSGSAALRFFGLLAVSACAVSGIFFGSLPAAQAAPGYGCVETSVVSGQSTTTVICSKTTDCSDVAGGHTCDQNTCTIRTQCALPDPSPTPSGTPLPNPPINPNLPISSPVPVYGPLGKGPAAVVANFYTFAFGIAGFLAFIMIIYGGARYAFSAGNHSAQSDAKDAIKQALLGLGLLLVGFLILQTINPDLTTLKLPTLAPYNPPQGSVGNPTVCGPLYGYCPVGSCQPDPKASGTFACYALPAGRNFGCISSDGKSFICAPSGPATTKNTCLNLESTGQCVRGTCEARQQACDQNVSTNCSIPSLTALTGTALAMENGQRLLFGSEDPKIQQNLVKLVQEFGKMQQALSAKGLSVSPNSAYRPLAYQNHFYEICDRYKNPSLATTPGCATLKEIVYNEKSNHGLNDACLVAKPNACAPHVRGVAIDVDITGAGYNGPHDLRAYAAADQILAAAGIDLRWRKLGGDEFHFELRHPVAGCP